MKDQGLPPPDGEPGDLDLLILSDQRTAFHQMLKNLRDGRLADWYLSAIMVLRQDSNPDRLALAAHSMREVIEKLPDEMELPVSKNSSLSSQRVKSLHEKWQRVKLQPEGITFDNRRLPGFLNDLDEFFAGIEISGTKWRDDGRMIQDKLDPLGATMPSVLREERASNWVELRRYCLNVCHHNFVPDAAEFSLNMDRVETFLLDLARPRSVDNQAEILALIEEAENSGNN